MTTRSRNYNLNKELNKELRSKKMTDNQTVKDFFFSMSQNIITPEFISCGSRRNFKIIYEVTQGYGISGDIVYGLSVYEFKNEKDVLEYHRTSYGGLYHTKRELDDALKEL